jgi:ABC-type transport system involved in multi-copper enzyme maturation permease subunit
MTITMLSTGAATRRATGGWLAETWRLTWWNVFLAWRRLMSKILMGILLGGYGIVFGIMILLSNLSSNDAGVRDALTFPLSLGIAGGVVRELGPWLVCVLAGAVIGGEYGFGTHRLTLSRGMSRSQTLTAQVAAFALIALITTAGMLLAATLLGLVTGPLLGADLVAPTSDGWLQLVGYWLALSLNLWGYMLIAGFFATLGRSSAAGIAGGVGYILVEGVAVSVLAVAVAVVAISSRSLDAATQAAMIANWLPGGSLGALVGLAAAGPIDLSFGAPAAAISVWQAVLVPLGYCAVLIGASYAFFRFRDITD